MVSRFEEALLLCGDVMFFLDIDVDNVKVFTSHSPRLNSLAESGFSRCGVILLETDGMCLTPVHQDGRDLHAFTRPI